MKKNIPVVDVGASVRGHLQFLARQRGEDFQFVLTRYANERFLYRLSVSPHAERFVLKGAALFTLWTGKPHRATRDLDLLGFGESGPERLREVFSEVLAQVVPADGMNFDVDTLAVSLIREEQEYGGVRIEVIARITSAKVRLQIDVGFGDAITPGAVMADFPPLLDHPSPRLRVYPRETVVAEKLEAMVQLGLANSRMKDFYDLFVLARDFDFDGVELVQAIRATFHRRRTPWPKTPPPALGKDFAGDPSKLTQWSGFLRKAGVRDAGDLAGTIAAVAVFLEGPLFAAARGTSFPAVWHAPGPWWFHSHKEGSSPEE